MATCVHSPGSRQWQQHQPSGMQALMQPATHPVLAGTCRQKQYKTFSCVNRTLAATILHRHYASSIRRRGPQPTAVVAAIAVTAQPAAAAGVASPVASFVAVALGYACLFGSCFRSVPQIAKVVKNNSTEGLSLTSNVSELLCYTITVAYNISQGYAFNTYGEVFACWIQQLMLVALMLKHAKMKPVPAIASAAAFASVSAWLMSSACPKELLCALQLSTIFFMAVGARLPQILLNIKRGNAGMLSITTCLLNVAGNAIRIFTTIVLTQDMIILFGVALQGVLNTVLLYQATVSPATKVAEPAAAGKPSQAEPAPADQPEPQSAATAETLHAPPTILKAA